MNGLGHGSARAEWKSGWPVALASGLGMALTSLAVYSTGVFMGPIEQEFGWSRTEISLGLTIQTFIGAILSPVLGVVIDRTGPRRIAIVGVIGYCAMIAALSLTGREVWTWWLLWALLAFIGMGSKPITWTTGVSSLFDKGRGLALSVMLCGTGLGSALTPLVGNALIESYGWRMAYVGLAAFWAVLVLPPTVLIFSSARDRARLAAVRAPERTAAAPLVLTGLSAREALLSWRFVRLAVAAFLTSLAAVSFVVNMVPILVSQGLERGEAAQAAGLGGISTVIGRLTGGYLLDRVNGNRVAAASIVMPIVSCGLLLAQPGSLPVAMAAALVLGLALGSELDAVAYLTTRHFGMRSFGALFGTISGVLAAATGSGPLIVSRIYDLTGSYHLVLIGYIPVAAAAALLFLSLGRYPDFDATETA